MPYPVHPMDPNDPNYDPKLDPHNPQYTPNDPRLVGGVSPYVKGKKTITDDDWGHLLTGQPHPSQVAGEGVAGSNKITDDDWGHLLTGEPEPPLGPPQPTTVAESVAQSKQQGLGVAPTFQNAIRTLATQHPTATKTMFGAAALAGGIPLAGAGAYYAGLPIAAAMRAYPPLGYMIGGAAGSLFGEPVTRAAHSVWNAVEGLFP